MYTTAKNKPFYYTLIYLNIFLWYPLKNGKGYKKRFFCVFAVVRTISLLCSIGTWTHLILTIKNVTGIDVSEDIGDIVAFAGCMYLCGVFLWYHSKWSQLFITLIDFKRFGKPPEYDKTVKRCNIVSKACLLLTPPLSFWYYYGAYLSITKCKNNNIRMHLNEPCGMIQPTWMPVNQTERTAFIIYYLVQIFGITWNNVGGFSICLISWEAVELIVARMHHLKQKFTHIFESQNHNIRLRALQHCIAYHQDIVKISEDLGDLVRVTIGSFFLTAALVIGALGTQILKESAPKTIALVIGITFSVFIACHAGQRLIDESLDLADHVYDLRWYEMDSKAKKGIIFILARCQRPLTLSAPFAMGSIDYMLFSVMIKTAYTYLTMLNQVV